VRDFVGFPNQYTINEAEVVY
jgi:hypothetical protein